MEVVGAFFGLMIFGGLLGLWIVVCHRKRFSVPVRLGGCAVACLLPSFLIVAQTSELSHSELLVFAVREGNVAEVKSLLERGASPNADLKVGSAMKSARQLYEDHNKAEIMRLLRLHGATDITEADRAFLEASEHNGQIPVQGKNSSYVELIRGYRNWRKVNPKPVRMEPEALTACDIKPSQMPGPHLQKYITVFVNPVGREAMIRMKEPKFPAGTVIVKEKLSALNSKSPELMTVMVKRQKGYNSHANDWEFLVYDGTGTKVESRGNQATCQNCHEQWPASQTDYVFRDLYLPTKQMAALK